MFALTRWCGNEHGGHNWPRCLAAFANLGHLCTCRTSSLSPSQLRLKSSCSSWFSHRKPVMIILNWRMLEDAPSYDTLWQIWVLKTRLKILNHWMLGLQFSREHQLSKTVEWDKVAQGLGLAGSRWHFFTVKMVRLLIFSFIWKCLLRETSYLVLSWTFRGKNQPCPLWRQDSVRTCQIMNFACSFLGTLMRTILVVCILNGCVIVLSLF